MALIEVHTPKMAWATHGDQYLMITMKGIEFVEKWHMAERLPSRITKLYQLFLRLIWMRGIMPVDLARWLGYGKEVLEQAISSSYVEMIERPSELPEEVQNKIEEMIGKAPREIYA